MNAGYPNQPHPQNEAIVNLAFWGLLTFFLGTMALMVAPALVVAVVAVLGVKVLKGRAWTLLAAALLSLFSFTAVGMDPADHLNRVFGKARKMWTHHEDDSFGWLWRKKEKLWVLGLPASVPLGFFLGAAAVAWTERRHEWWDPRAESQIANKIIKARRAAARRVAKAPDEVRGLAVLGAAASGDLGRDWVARSKGRPWVVFDPSNLGRHVAVVGQPGSGKTVTLLRLAYVAAKVYGWRVYFLDGKGDRDTQRQFVAAMLEAGIAEDRVGVFPSPSFDGWRTTGTGHERFTQLLNRLLGVIRFSEPYYEDATRAFLSRALSLEGQLPDSSTELLRRLDLVAASAPTEQRKEALGAVLRYKSFFESFSGRLDGHWTYEDVQAAYILLEGLAQPKEAGRLAAYLFECFKHFATQTKHSSERVLLIVDDFPAIQADADVAGLIERLRSFGCSVALSAQSYEGLGEGRKRIIGAVRSLILHSCPEADELIKTAGTIHAHAVTSQIDHRVGPTGRGSATPEHRYRTDPNEVGSQAEGEAFVISHRQAQQVSIAVPRISMSAISQADRFLHSSRRVEDEIQVEHTPNHASEVIDL